GGAGPNGQTATEWLHGLREQNKQLAQKHGFERVRQQAEKQAQAPAGPRSVARESASSDDLPYRLRDDGLLAHGLPTHWQIRGDGAAPAVELSSVHAGEVWRAVLVSVLLVAVAVFIGWLGRFPGLLPWARRFWPEQLALAGFLLWHVFHFGP